MRRWMWGGASAICGSSPLLVVMSLMYCIWVGATAEIVSSVSASRYRGDVAAILLASINAPFAGWLFANFLKLRIDLGELRAPRRRQLLTGSLTFFLGLTVVAPCAFALLWRVSPFDVLMVVLASVAGMAGALSWTLLVRRHSAERVTSVCEGTWAARGTIPSRSRALRVALGPPYSPVPWRVRLIQLALLLVVLFAPAVTVIAFGRSLSSRTFAAMMHASEFLSFLVAIGLCWGWPLSRMVTLFNPTPGASTELALLPGLGDGKERLGRLLLVAISPPAVALVALLLIAMGAAWLERPANAVYVKLAVEFSMVPLFTLPAFLGQVARPWRRRKSALVFVLMLSPTYALNSLIWNLSWAAFTFVPWLHWLSLGFVLLILILMVGMAFFSLRKVMQRPHPFVDVSS